MTQETTSGAAPLTATESAAGAATATSDAPRRAATEEMLKLRFRCAGQGDATRILYQATLEHLLARAA